MVTEATAVSTVGELRDHWQWRPDWEVDRPYLLWYLTFEQPLLQKRIQQAQESLGNLPTLDVVPPRWLHLTLDDVGFDDAVAPEQVVSVLSEARAALKGFAMPPLTLGPVTTTASAVVLLAKPVRQLERLRSRLRAATIGVLGSRARAELQQFRPHVSLAYTNHACVRHSLMERAAAIGSVPIVVQVSHVTLAAVTRRDHHYQWKTREVIPLTAAPAAE